MSNYKSSWKHIKIPAHAAFVAIYTKCNMTTIKEIVEHAIPDSSFIDREIRYYPRLRTSQKKSSIDTAPRSLKSRLHRTRTTSMDIMKWEYQIIGCIYNAYRKGDGCVPSIKLDNVLIDYAGDIVYPSVIRDVSVFHHGYEATAINSIIQLHDSMITYAEESCMSHKVIVELKSFCVISNFMYASLLRTNDTCGIDDIIDMARIIYESVVCGIIDNLIGIKQL